MFNLMRHLTIGPTVPSVHRQAMSQYRDMDIMIRYRGKQWKGRGRIRKKGKMVYTSFLVRREGKRKINQFLIG